MQIGLHRGVPAETYHGWRLPSNSTLAHMLRSPAHFRHALEHGSESTEAMRIGTATHMAVLEPSRYLEQYAALPEGLDRRTKEGKERYAALEARYGAERLLSHDDAERIALMSVSIRSNDAARKLLDALTDIELSGVFEDPVTGSHVKFRIDGLAAGLAVTDLKTTRDASEREFTRSIFNFGYHRQGALYLWGLEQLGIQIPHYCIIAVEKEAPYGVAVYRLDEAAIAAGRAQVEDLLGKYATCKRLGHWGCYSNFAQTISLPEWAFNKMEGQSHVSE